MPCCILIATVLAWASAALGAQIYRAQADTTDYGAVFAVFGIACALMAIAPLLPPAAAITVAAIMAAHAALIAAMLIVDALRWKRRPQLTLRWDATRAASDRTWL